MDEIALVQKVKNGDTASFRFLYRLHAASSWHLAISICKHHANAEEVVQNSFIAAFKYIHNFQAKSSFKTWLLRIVFHEAIRVQKKEKAYQWVEVDASVLNEEINSIDGFELLQRKEMQVMVAKIIGAMSEKESLVLHLFYIEELSLKEVVVVLGFTEANVKVLLHRARKNFKQQFEKFNLAV